MSTTAPKSPNSNPEKAFSMVFTWPNRTTLVPRGASEAMLAMTFRMSLATAPKSLS